MADARMQTIVDMIALRKPITADTTANSIIKITSKMMSLLMAATLIYCVIKGTFSWLIVLFVWLAFYVGFVCWFTNFSCERFLCVQTPDSATIYHYSPLSSTSDAKVEGTAFMIHCEEDKTYCEIALMDNEGAITYIIKVLIM